MSKRRPAPAAQLTISTARQYRILDPGSPTKLCRVEYSDDGNRWRETPNGSRRSIEHYKLHGTMPPGFDSTTWANVRPRWDAAIAVGADPLTANRGAP